MQFRPLIISSVKHAGNINVGRNTYYGGITSSGDRPFKMKKLDEQISRVSRKATVCMTQRTRVSFANISRLM